MGKIIVSQLDLNTEQAFSGAVIFMRPFITCSLGNVCVLQKWIQRRFSQRRHSRGWLCDNLHHCTHWWRIHVD